MVFNGHTPETTLPLMVYHFELTAVHVRETTASCDAQVEKLLCAVIVVILVYSAAYCLTTPLQECGKLVDRVQLDIVNYHVELCRSGLLHDGRSHHWQDSRPFHEVILYQSPWQSHGCPRERGVHLQYKCGPIILRPSNMICGRYLHMMLLLSSLEQYWLRG